MAANYSKEVRLQHDIAIWDLRQQLWTEPRIAAELHLDVATVCRTLQRLSKRYRAQHTEEVDQILAEQIEQHKWMADEAIQAWERSKEAAKTITQKKTGVALSDGRTVDSVRDTTQSAKDQDGDPRYLAEAREQLAAIRKMTGADAPTKTEQSGTLEIHVIYDQKQVP